MSRKSCGDDMLHPTLLKLSAPHVIALPVSKIISYPVRWKMGQVTPLLESAHNVKMFIFLFESPHLKRNFGARTFRFEREANFLRILRSYFYLVHPFRWSGLHGLAVTYIQECLLAWVLCFLTDQRQCL